MPHWTAEQIIALAPDAASATAGRGLAAVSHWATLGANERAAWGECRGSGKNPYQVVIDLSEPAFKCSCPSRKFPCKHALGLFLLRAAGQIKAAAPPAFCLEWLAKRDAAHAATQTRKEQPDAAPTPEEIAKREKAKTKRVEQRETKVAAGLTELELWLADLVRQSLATAQNQPGEYWEKMARRLIDAQAPNLARLVREMSSAVYERNEPGKMWADALLERAGKIYLVCESYRRLGELPAPVRADVRAAIGFAVREDELEAAETVADVWQIVGARVDEEEKLRVQRVWLRGEQTARDALVLNFAFQNQPLDAGFAVGARFRANAWFYPGNYPLRAAIKNRVRLEAAVEPDGWADFADFLENYARALARNVWLEVFPALVRSVVPVRRGGAWFLRDRDGGLLPLATNFAGAWQLAAACGNQPAHSVFAEWNGAALLPLAAWVEGRTIRF